MDNYKTSERDGVRVQAPLVDRVIMTDLSTDFSLPDYRPEIKRLLRVRACVMPVDAYIGVGNAQMNGRVEYSVLYAGGDGALHCVTHGEDFEFNVPVEMTSEFELGDGLVCDVESFSELATGRVAAPRKVALKCRVRSRVRILGTRVLSEGIGSMDGMERLCGSASSGTCFVGKSDPVQLGDEILYEGSDLRVISADGQVFVTEATAGSGVVNCRGEVVLKLLCVNDVGGEAPFLQTRRLPFSQSVPTDGAEVNCDAAAFGVCPDISVTVEEGRLLCEVSAVLQVRAQRNDVVGFVRDAYSTSHECAPKYKDAVLSRALRCINGNFSLNQMLTLEEAGIHSHMNVVDVCMTPMLEEVVCERGKYVLTGRCRCQTVLFDGEEYSAGEFEIPFRYEADGGEEMTDYDCVVEAVSCRARMDGERIGIDAELSVAMRTRGDTRFRLISEASVGDAVKRTGAFCTICYPAPDDTLWSVAKRYHRSVSTISHTNSLAGAPSADSRESLAGVSYLLV